MFSVTFVTSLSWIAELESVLPGVRDIFVEVDWMASPPGDEGVTPRPEAIAKVVQAFAAGSAARSDVQVAIHFDGGQMGGLSGTPWKHI